jgi:hypothetical protein
MLIVQVVHDLSILSIFLRRVLTNWLPNKAVDNSLDKKQGKPRDPHHACKQYI